MSKAELIASIDATVNEVAKVLEQLPAGGLLDRFPIQAYSTSLLQAIYHVIEHFSYHLEQVLYIYKMRTDRDPGFYRHLAPRI